MIGYRSKILATGSAFPPARITNDVLAARVQTTEDWIVERTGIRARRIADVSKGETTSELALGASRQALARGGLSARDVDFILLATVSPDHIMPNTACILQEKIKADRAAALDISAACSGFVYALSIADAFVRTGQARTVLVVGADVLSPFVNWQDRDTCVLFADGAGAVVVTPAEPAEGSRIYSSHLHADGRLKDLFIVPAGGSAIPVSHEALDRNLQYMQMKGREIFKIAVRMLADSAMEALEANGFKVADLDWMVPHQANRRIIEAVAKKLDLPLDKVVMNIAEFGNTSAATVPTALDGAVSDGRIRRGQLVLLCAFGAGLTYGSSLLRF